jgi:hypothetical protein
MRNFTLLCFCILLAGTALAQSPAGTLTGTVKDSSGALVPGVTITMRNVATNESRQGLTNDVGLYRITNLPRGTYEAKAEMTGFKTITQTDVLVTVGETVRLDFNLQIGQLNENITVTSQAALVNTEEGRISNLVDERRVMDLPLNGRNAMSLMELQSGAVANPGGAVLGGTAGGNTAFVNGQRNRGNNFLLDGTDNNDQYTGGRVSVNPSVDIIQEFRVSSLNFSAEFGRNSSTAVNVVTKSGTNSIHGSAYEFIRNDALDARTIFAAKKDPLRFNQFGGTVGGPIIKDKAFFFGSYEGLRQTRATTGIYTVETPEFRNMVIQKFPNSIGAFLYKNFPAPAPTSNIRDTGQPVTGLATDSAANNPGVKNNPNYVPSGSLYRNQLQATPDGIMDIGNVAIPVSETDSRNQYSIRVDYDYSSNVKIFGRYLRDLQDASDNASITRPGFNQPVTQHGQVMTLGNTIVFNPKLVNEARFGFNRRFRGLGVSSEGVPYITFDDGALPFGDFPTNPANWVQNTFHWADTISYTRGRHSLKFGGELRRIQDNSNFATKRPQYSFYSIFDFAQDESRLVQNAGINPGTGLITTNVRGFRFWETGVFLQDDWKIRPNFTLNLGIRHEWFGRPGEVNGLLNTMIPGQGADIFERIKTATVAVVDQVVPNDLNNFAPRLGFAWDVTGKGRFSIRGGIGVSYDRLFNNSITNIRFNPPFYSFAVANPVQVTSQAGIPIAYGPKNPDGSAKNEPIRIDGANKNPGVGPDVTLFGNIIGWNYRFGTSQQSLRVPDPDTRDSYTTNWFFGIQYELFNNWVLEANYVANSGKKFGQLVDYNTLRGDLFDGKLDRLNPGFGSINFRTLGTSTVYHSGQFQLNRRYANGITTQLAYTYGKGIDTGSDIQVGGLPVDARALYLERSVSDFNITHRFAGSVLWEMPFFKQSTGVTQALLGGWQVNGIVSLQTGFPFSVNTSRAYGAGGDFNGDGNNNDRPNEPSFGNTVGNVDKQDYLKGLFKASDFPITGFVLGNLGRGTFRGPGYASTDISLFKNFRLPITEATRLQFRAEFFNVFNRTNLRNPSGNLASGTFGRSVASHPAREIQFAMKIIF